MWEIIEQELEFSGDKLIELGDGKRSENGDVSLALIEIIEGEVDATPPNTPTPPIDSGDGDVAAAPQPYQYQQSIEVSANKIVAVVKFNEGNREFTLRLIGRAAKIKVSTIKFFRNVVPTNKCEWCQKALKILLSSLMGDVFGAGIELGIDTIPDNFGDSLRGRFSREPFIWIWDKLDNSQIAEALGELLSKLVREIKLVAETRNQLVLEACQEAGFCS